MGSQGPRGHSGRAPGAHTDSPSPFPHCEDLGSWAPGCWEDSVTAEQPQAPVQQPGASRLLTSGAGHCLFLSPQGADSGGSSSSSGSGSGAAPAAPAAPAGGSRSSSRNSGSSGGEKEEGRKVRRQWESWSAEDKNTFFEGLYEVSARPAAACWALCPRSLPERALTCHPPGQQPAPHRVPARSPGPQPPG